MFAAFFAGAGAKLLAIGLAVALIFGAGFAVRGHYAATAMAAHLKVDQNDENQRIADTAKKDAETASRELKASHDNADARAAYVAEQSAHAADNARHLADLAAGRVGVRVRLVPGTCGAEALPPGSAASGADGEATAQLAPDVAASVERIADTGDDAIRQLTALQDWVDRNVRAVNGQQPAGEVTP